MDVFLLPFIFSFWAAIYFLLLTQALIQVISSKQNIIWFTRHLLKIFNQGILQTLQWIGFLFWLFVSSYSGCFWLQILQWIFMVPITFITFFQYIYNFGPKHCKWSLFDILSNPVPGVKFDGRIGKSKDFASLKRRWFNWNSVAQKNARDKHLSAKQATQSSTLIIHDCLMAHTNNANPVLSGYQMYATFYNTSMEDEVVKSGYSMPNTLQFAICNFS